MKHLLFIFAAGLLVACGGESNAPAETYTVANMEDPTMVKAMAAAKKTLPGFLEKMKNPPQDWSNLSLKVGFPTRDNSLEHIWLLDIEPSGEAYIGTVGNDPYNVEGLKYGDRTEFEVTDITDWQYMKGGKIHGHYTTRAMLPTMSPEQRAQMVSLLSKTPE